jgi:hypothetical protein
MPIDTTGMASDALKDKPDWYTGEWGSLDKSKPILPEVKPLGGAIDKTRLLKDFGVNVASQIPLAALPEGKIGMTALRALSSVASGYGADRILNGGDKSQGESLGDAALNTGLSMAIPGLMENKISYGGKSALGTGTKAIALKVMSALNPLNYTAEPRMMMRPGASVPVPQNFGNIVKDLLTKHSSVPMAVRNGAAGIPANQFELALKNLFGLSLNTGVDSTINKPTE